MDDGSTEPPPAGLTAPLAPPAPRPGLGVGAAVVLGLLAVATVWAAFAGVGPAGLDAEALADSISARTGTLNDVALVITNIGSTWSMAVLAVLVGAWCWARGRNADAVFVVVAMAGGALLMRGLKGWFNRPRPPVADQIQVLTNASLPSGHATMASVVIFSLVVLAWAGRGRAARIAMVALAVVWVGAVGVTRIYLGAHWFSDVVAGWCVGAAWLALCTAGWSWWRARRPAEARPVS
ncbi:phosphatase PAP2 family protein [Pseudonocardia sp. GCM10023141]|uniref:phosphatase PAP2 family protein n=1 Tax=Pseudonocardia sp. GCM10023141 TaxID=3252653 RepID=UPI00360C5168